MFIIIMKSSSHDGSGMMMAITINMMKSTIEFDSIFFIISMPSHSLSLYRHA